MELTPQQKHLADAYEYFFNGKKTYHHFFSKDQKHHFHIVTHGGDLGPQIDTFTSIGLTGKLSHELIAVARQDQTKVQDIMGALSLNLMEQNTALQFGDILHGVIEHFIEGEMKHILCVEPFLWGHYFGGIEFRLLCPISDQEWEFAEKYGIDRLVELFQIYDIDLSDWNRESVQIPNLP